MRSVKRVSLEPGTDLVDVLEGVRRDKEPRLIERDGEELAVVVSIEDYRRALSDEDRETSTPDIMAYAGIWSDLDADRLIRDIYQARHDAPPSPPVRM